MTGMSAWVMTTLVCALLVASPLEAANADVTLENGLYQGIVLGIDPATPEPENGETFLDEIKVFLEAGSGALYAALDGKAAFGDVKLVLPRSWNKTKFATVHPAAQELTIESADILLHDTADSLPSTLQAEQCGVPGRQIKIPLSFLSLTADEQNIYGTTGRILAHEWAHYRYGVHDEHGFPADSVYPIAYGDDDTLTACSVGALTGSWRTSCTASSPSCRPKASGCYFCIANHTTASVVQASLGYMPALSTGQFCNSSTHNRLSPSPQNLLCGRRSVMQVIQAHPDFQSINNNVNVGSINIHVYEEPLGRVMLLFDTPPNTGEVLDYDELLSNLEGPLTKYSHLPVSLLSFQYLESDNVELSNHRPFAHIQQGTFSFLSSFVPQSESRVAVPDLALVLAKVLELEDFATEYSLGTLLVIPVTNQLMGASKLDVVLGNTLRSHHIKPLLLFPEVSPALARAGSFFQQSGARFIARNQTAGPLNYASMVASAEINAFVDNTFQRDHAIVAVDVTLLPGTQSFNSPFWYQRNIAQHLMAVLTTDGDIRQLKLKYYRLGQYTDCQTINMCTITDDSIFFLTSHTQAYNFPANYWHMELENTGSENVQVTLTRSIVNFVQETKQELSVDVWSSDGRGPVAAVSENNQFVLYASVSNRGKQVLGSHINVLVDVDFQRPGSALESILSLPLRDDGTLADLRKDDSVFSGYLSADPFENGTIVNVKTVKVASHTISGELRPSSLRQHKRHASAASARLFSRDPEEEECCGSFVKVPDTEVQHNAKGYFLHLPDPIEPIVVTRTPAEALTTTTAAPTTSTTTTAPSTTTTAAPPASTTTTAAPPASTTTTAAPPASTTTATTVQASTSTKASPTMSTRAPTLTTTAGVCSLETSVTVFLQTAVALYLARLIHSIY